MNLNINVPDNTTIQLLITKLNLKIIFMQKWYTLKWKQPKLLDGDTNCDVSIKQYYLEINKELTTDILSNMDESQMCYNIKNFYTDFFYVVYDSFFMTIWNGKTIDT